MLEGKLIRQRYQILKKIGQGSFGITYLAEDKDNLNKKCVVKLLNPPSLDKDIFKKSIELFEREAKTLAELGKHDQIPTLLAYFQQEDDFYLVQEYVEGHPLSEEKQVMNEDDIIDFLCQILTILQEVHKKNVIHRDIKPSNLMRRSSDNKIILIDFGGIKNINQKASEQKQKPPTCLGTPGYMPPEQYNGKPCFASDIYSLGKTALHMLTGSLDGTIPPDINPQLINILQRMTEMQWENRYQSADQVLQDLSTIKRIDKIPQTDLSDLNQEDYQSEIQKTRSVTNQSQSLPDSNATVVVAKKFPVRIVGSALAVLTLGVIGFYIFPTTPPPPSPSNNPSVHIEKGVAHYESKEYDQAIAEYSKAIEINPNYADAYYNRGLVYDDLKEYSQAIADYSKAIEINPNYADAYYNRGLIHYNLKEYDQAIADYSQAIEINPNYANAHYNRGLVYDNLEEYEQAILDIEKASELYRQQGNQEAYQNSQQSISLIKPKISLPPQGKVITSSPQGKVITSQDGTTQVVVPESWSIQQDLNDIADLQVADIAEENYLIVISEPKSDFDNNVSVEQYSEMTRKFILESVQGGHLSEPVNFTINGNVALQYQIIGSFDGLYIVYLHTVVEGDEDFHQLLAWTLLDKLEENEPILKSVVNSFQEN